MKRFLAIAIVFLAASAQAQIRVERNIPVGQIVPDQGQYVSSVVVPNPGMTSIFDVRASLFLSSPDVANLMWLGDMYATLTHGTASENERVAVLLNRPGRSTADEYGSVLSSLAVTFDDSGAAPNVFSASSPTGVYRADGRLSVDPYSSPVAFSAGNAGLDALDGPWLASNRWSLLVADTEAGGQGRLDGWKLTITGFGAPTGTLDPGAGGTITDVAGATNTVGAVVNVGDGTGANGVTTAVSNTMTFDGGISGSGDMVKSGSGTLVLGGPSTNFTGVVRVNEGKLEIGASNAVGSGRIALEGTNVQMRVGNGVQFSAPIEVSTNGAKLLGSGILAGAISGQGRVTKTDADSTLVLAGSNSFTGGTTISNGALRLANSHAAGLGGVIVAQGARLELSNAIRITNTIDATGQIQFVSSGNVLAGTIINRNTPYVVNPGDTNTVEGYITGEGGLELSGGGVLQVTGATNDYQGATTISNGTLRVSTLADTGTASSIGIDNSIVLAGSTAASAILQYTNTTDVAMNRDITLTNNGGGTFDVTESAATVTLTGSMANASGTTNTFIKAGAGEIVLSNGSTANNFAATAIQVNAGSLTLGAANQIANGTDLILNGGTFRTGNASAGYAESLGDLTLNASSTIDLGAAAGLRDLIFLDSSGVAWSGGATLTVANWAGAITGGTRGRVFFGSNSSGLGSGQLSQITFSGYSAGAQILGTGEIVPLNLTTTVPEPGTYASAAILILLALWHHRRRRQTRTA
ncbi:MAG: beta strand repeat-containing protein [Sphaerospermopsis kisseleviana]